MVDKLQMAVQESLSPQNTQSVNKCNPVALPVIENKKLFDNERYCRMNSVFDNLSIVELIGLTCKLFILYCPLISTQEL